MNERKPYHKRAFDFDIGHLVKSPCRDCPTRFQFPRCIGTCETLDRIQTRLARAISSTCTHSAFDPFEVNLDKRRQP